MQKLEIGAFCNHPAAVSGFFLSLACSHSHIKGLCCDMEFDMTWGGAKEAPFRSQHILHDTHTFHCLLRPWSLLVLLLRETRLGSPTQLAVSLMELMIRDERRQETITIQPHSSHRSRAKQLLFFFIIEPKEGKGVGEGVSGDVDDDDGDDDDEEKSHRVLHCFQKGRPPKVASVGNDYSRRIWGNQFRRRTQRILAHRRGEPKKKKKKKYPDLPGYFVTFIANCMPKLLRRNSPLLHTTTSFDTGAALPRESVPPRWKSLLLFSFLALGERADSPSYRSADDEPRNEKRRRSPPPPPFFQKGSIHPYPHHLQVRREKGRSCVN